MGFGVVVVVVVMVSVVDDKSVSICPPPLSQPAPWLFALLPLSILSGRGIETA
jgi:hypothetical protein